MSVPRFSSIASCFPVADVGATMRWYEQHLGFTGHPFPKIEPYAFCIMVRDRIEIMLQRIEDYRKLNLYEMRTGGDAYFRMHGVKDFYESVRRDLEILRPLEKQFYGDGNSK